MDRSSDGGKRGRVTSIDIAHLAGVSQATVSRVLRGEPRVSQATRDKVMAAVQELRYTVDSRASNLRLQRTGTLALLLFEDPTDDDSHINPFFLSMLGSITRASARAGQDLLVSFQQLSDDWHADYADSRKADGLILLGYGDYLAYRCKLEKLVEQGTRFVRWGAVLPDQPGLSIGCDNFQGGRLVGEHLLQLGRRRVAFLGDASQRFPEFHDRWRGCGAAFAEAGQSLDPALQVDAHSAEESGHDAALELVRRGRCFDALFAASDLIAVGALRALAEQGVSVPQEVAVVGFDDIPAARFSHPPLTTVAQDTASAGAMLVDTVMRQVRGEPVGSVMLPATLRVRQSSDPRA